MDFAHKATLTATAVAMVLMAARLFGRSFAGLLAGLPIVSAPTLVWLAFEQGPTVAERAAIGSVAACVVAAVFALVYDRAARRLSPWPASTVAAASIGVTAVVAQLWLGELPVALAAALSICVLVIGRLRTTAALLQPAPIGRVATIATTALIAGLVSATIASLAQRLDPFFCGLLASLPFISGAVVVTEHARGSPVAVTRFLRGYVAGLFGKAAFGASFAIAVVLVGPEFAVVLAASLCVLTSMPALHLGEGRAADARGPAVGPSAPACRASL